MVSKAQINDSTINHSRKSAYAGPSLSISYAGLLLFSLLCVMSLCGHTLSYDIVYEISQKMVIKWLNMWVFPTFLAFQVLMSALCLSLNKVFPLNQPACTSIIWRTIELISNDCPSLHHLHPNIYSTLSRIVA